MEPYLKQELDCSKIMTCLFSLMNLIFLIFSNGRYLAYFCMVTLFFDFIITINIYSGIDQKKFQNYIISIVLISIKAIFGIVASGFLFRDFSIDDDINLVIFLIADLASFWLELIILCCLYNKTKELLEEKSDAAQIPIQNLNNQPLVS